MGDVVVVATKGSSLFVFDAKSAHLVRKFDIFPSSQLLGKQSSEVQKPELNREACEFSYVNHEMHVDQQITLSDLIWYIVVNHQHTTSMFQCWLGNCQISP